MTRWFRRDERKARRIEQSRGATGVDVRASGPLGHGGTDDDIGEPVAIDIARAAERHAEKATVWSAERARFRAEERGRAGPSQHVDHAGRSIGPRRADDEVGVPV